jgi:tetratricopeptide (TPR) repeat protein
MVWPLIGLGAGTAFFIGCGHKDKPGQKIVETLYKSFNLPTNGNVSADQNDFTRRIDGNTDSNRDGRIDKSDKDGFIEPEELFEELFSNREKYQAQIKALYAAGLEDPLEKRKEIKDFVSRLFSRYQPQDEMAKAVLLYRAVIPSREKFVLDGKQYSGLTIGEGGLEVRPDMDCMAPQRVKHGDLLPKEILSAPPKERVALCSEISQILAMFFKEAGMDCRIKSDSTGGQDHVVGVVRINGSSYALDAGNFTFSKTNASGFSTHREIVAGHYQNEAAFLWGQGRLDQAMADNDLGLKIDKNNSAIWVNKGMVYLTMKDKEKARDCFKIALEIDPADGEALLNMGNIYHLEGNKEQANKCYDMSIRACPRFADPWMEKGKQFGEEGKTDEELKCYKKAFVIAPKDPAVSCALGGWYLGRSQHVEALRYYSDTLNNDPRSADALYGKGLCLLATGHRLETIQCFDETLRGDPSASNVWFVRGTLYLQDGLYKKAAECFSEAINIDQHYIEAWNNKANALLKLGKLKAAMRCCDDAIKINPQYARLWYNKAQIYKAMGDRFAAEQCLEKFKQLSAISIK